MGREITLEVLGGALAFLAFGAILILFYIAGSDPQHYGVTMP